MSKAESIVISLYTLNDPKYFQVFNKSCSRRKVVVVQSLFDSDVPALVGPTEHA